MALSPPGGLGERGGALWVDLTTGRSWDAPGLVLVTEACRLADRLERMDAILRGEVDEWMRIAPAGDELVIRVDAVLGEARLHAGALRQLLAQLRLGAVVAPGAADEEQPEESRLDDLSRARARRGAATSDPGGATRG